jgi:hypothetical protein
MPQDRPVPGSSADWLARAKGDLAIAKAPLPEGAFHEDLCFHAQQAAEKAMKPVGKALLTKLTFTDPVMSKYSNTSPSTTVHFRAGLSCTWDISTPVKKHYRMD